MPPFTLFNFRLTSSFLGPILTENFSCTASTSVQICTSSYAEASLGKVQSIADGTTDTIVGNPLQHGGIDASLEDEILDQTTGIDLWIPHQR